VQSDSDDRLRHWLIQLNAAQSSVGCRGACTKLERV
jgi:hypothetical protein